MFIAFEGLDGAGTTTHSKHLAERLEAEGHSVLLTNEPTGSEPIGTLIRDVLQHKYEISAESLQLLFSADRADHLKNKILPALAEDKIVITDRYFFSTLAYGGLSVDVDWLKEVSKNFPIPDLTILCECDTDTCLNRIGGRGETPELFEKREKLIKIGKNYHELSEEYPNFYLLDSSRSIPVCDEEIWGVVSGKI
ncbi:dTMP kinase [Candidatus Peregrinibacteria bacterium]|nr:dTMP kinase [Candidatus Peregrinibacteria bacterium]